MEAPSVENLPCGDAQTVGSADRLCNAAGVRTLPRGLSCDVDTRQSWPFLLQSINIPNFHRPNPQPTVGHAFLPQVVQTSQNYMRQIVAVELVWVRPMLTKLETLDAERLMVRSHR